MTERQTELRDVLLLVSIDTEEDNMALTRVGVSVENVRELPRLAGFLMGLGVRATYFTTYQVANCPWAAGIVREISHAGGAEVAAHLHPWNTPPMEEPWSPSHSMMRNLPVPLQLAKLQQLTAVHQAAFGAAPTAFRAGRFGLGSNAVPSLVACGYRVDSSVTPFFSWEQMDNGPSFVGAPLSAYRIGQDADVTVPQADGPLVEIPLTCGYTGLSPRHWLSTQRVLASPASRLLHLAGLACRLGLLKLTILSPETDKVRDMLALSRRVLDGGVGHLQLFFHSPSLRPGLGRFSTSADDVERLYRSIERFLEGLSRMAPVRFATVSEAAEILGFGHPPTDPPIRSDSDQPPSAAVLQQ